MIRDEIVSGVYFPVNISDKNAILFWVGDKVGIYLSANLFDCFSEKWYKVSSVGTSSYTLIEIDNADAVDRLNHRHGATIEAEKIVLQSEIFNE